MEKYMSHMYVLAQPVSGLNPASFWDYESGTSPEVFSLGQGVHGGLLWVFIFVLRLTCSQAGLQLAPGVRRALNSPSTCVSLPGAGDLGVHHHMNYARGLLDRHLPNPATPPALQLL